MSDQGNIFLTYENLAFSLPLIFVVGIYLFFTYVPLSAAAVVLVVVYIIYRIRQQLLTQREKKLSTLDEKAIQDLVGEEDESDAKKDTESKKKQKTKNKVQQRLAKERKTEAKQSNNKKGKNTDKDVDDDDDDEDLAMFAKGSRDTKAKKQ